LLLVSDVLAVLWHQSQAKYLYYQTAIISFGQAHQLSYCMHTTKTKMFSGQLI